MALRDTLARLNNSTTELGQMSRSELKEEWIAAIDELLTKIESYLADYIENRSITAKRIGTSIRETDLGLYHVQSLIVTAGPAQIEIVPIGRIVAGAIGRVDMHRQGRSRVDQPVLLLRTDNIGQDGAALWRIYMPPPSLSSSVGVMVSRQPPEVYEFDKETFEYALDFLLR